MVLCPRAALSASSTSPLPPLSAFDTNAAAALLPLPPLPPYRDPNGCPLGPAELSFGLSAGGVLASGGRPEERDPTWVRRTSGAGRRGRRTGARGGGGEEEKVEKSIDDDIGDRGTEERCFTGVLSSCFGEEEDEELRRGFSSVYLASC